MIGKVYKKKKKFPQSLQLGRMGDFLKIFLNKGTKNKLRAKGEGARKQQTCGDGLSTPFMCLHLKNSKE